MNDPIERGFSGFQTNNSKQVPNSLFAMMPVLSNEELRVLLACFYYGAPVTRGQISACTGMSVEKVAPLLESMLTKRLLNAVAGGKGGGYLMQPAYAGMEQDQELVKWLHLRRESHKAKAAQKTNPVADLTPEQKAMFGEMVTTILAVCVLDGKLTGNRSISGKVAKELLVAGYTPKQVHDAFSLENKDSWWCNWWQSSKGKIPVRPTMLTGLIAQATQPAEEEDAIRLS